MSGFSSIAMPGVMPTVGGDPLNGHASSPAELMAANGYLKVKRVRVETFDLSDRRQARRYERLWKELLEKVSRMEAKVESRKDLVRRADGTSYWLKYVEYVEYEDAEGNS